MPLQLWMIGAEVENNRLLAALPRAELKRLVEHGSVVSLAFGRELYRQNSVVSHVYFPLSGVVSLLAEGEGNSQVEIAAIGNEGMIGNATVFGIARALGRNLVQVEGTALRVPVRRFTEAVLRGGCLPGLMNTYLYVLMRQLAQSGACNRLHSVTQRCARWLLTMEDRTGHGEFKLTQGFVAGILAVRRASAASALQDLCRAGAVSSRRGKVQILDRAILESFACSCYQVMDEEYRKLMEIRPAQR